MCGIFGILANPKSTMAQLRPLDAWAEDACILGTIRGEDSTGIFQVRRAHKEIKQFKLPYNGFLFSKEARARELITNVDISTITIGHHRAATRGSISIENAHPFEHKSADGKRHVIGVHNGGLQNHSTLEDGIRFDVDSDWAMYQIMKYGGSEAISKMNGAMALVWMEEDGKVRMYTNGKRPIHFAFCKDMDAMLIMSEHEMLYALASRNDIVLEDSIMYPSNDKKILVFDPSDLQNFTEEKTKPWTAPVYVQRTPVGGTVVHGRQHTDMVPRIGPSLPTTSHGGYSDGGQKTHQGFRVIRDDDSCRKAINLHVGESAYFTIQSGEDGGTDPNTVVGEVFKKRSDKDEVFEYAMILNVSAALKKNIVDAVNSQGQVECRVLGMAQLRVNEADYSAAVLGLPNSIVFGDSAEDGDGGVSDEDDFFTALVIPGPAGLLISKERFDELTGDGCACCSSAFTVKDAHDNKIIWVAGDVGGMQPVCGDCIQYYNENMPGALVATG